MLILKLAIGCQCPMTSVTEAMRRILVESARRRQQLKSGGEFCRAEAGDIAIVADNIQDDLIALDEALTKLRVVDEDAARLVQLRYFTGLAPLPLAEPS